MLKYIFYRILLFLPTLLIISLVIFYLGTLAPGSPIDKYCNSDDLEFSNEFERAKACQSAASTLGLDLPKFYFSISQRAFPSDFYKILRKTHHDNLELLILQYGDWNEIDIYYKSLLHLQNILLSTTNLKKDDSIIKIKYLCNQLLVEHNHENILNIFNQLEELMEQSFDMGTAFQDSYQQIVNNYGDVIAHKSIINLWIPKITWYGTNNQYHRWISKFLKGDFGISYFDSRKVTTRIKTAMKWTLIMNLIAIFFSYLISIPLGVYAAAYKNSLFDRWTTIGLFLLHSLPVFWVATMLIVFFTTPEYGAWTDFFPSSGLGDLPVDAPFWDRFWDTAYHLVLPIFCITYGTFAFTTRQMRNGMLNVLNQQYITTAKAKGLSYRNMVWKHGFKNGIFPLISKFATIFPAAFAGSVVVEIIFSIPGMGRLAYDGILQQDWPVVNAILLLSAFLTIVGYLVADILYKIFDPRVKF